MLMKKPPDQEAFLGCSKVVKNLDTTLCVYPQREFLYPMNLNWSG